MIDEKKYREEIIPQKFTEIEEKENAKNLALYRDLNALFLQNLM